MPICDNYSGDIRRYLEWFHYSSIPRSRPHNCTWVRHHAEELLNSVSWLDRSARVPRELAEQLVRRSAYWVAHPRGEPVRAPQHASHIVRVREYGLVLDLGNHFLVECAISIARLALLATLEWARLCRLPSYEIVERTLMDGFSGAVADHKLNPYDSYPVHGEYLMFGANGIHVPTATQYLLRASGVRALYVEAQF